MGAVALPEHSKVEGLQLSAATVAALMGNKAVTLRRSVGGADRWDIETNSRVGLIRTDDLTLRITPKTSVAQLLFMILFAGMPDPWLDTPGLLGESDWLNAAAHAFAHHSDRALKQGPLQGYVRREEALMGLRGRLREGDQLRRRYAQVVPLEVVYDDLTTDITENRILKSAFQRLLRLPISTSIRVRLRHLDRKLAGVTLIAGTAAPDVRTDRRNHRYAAALTLGRLIMRSTGIEFTGDSTPATGFVVDMNHVFERFVAAALQGRPVARVATQYSTYLDTQTQVLIRPDLVWIQHRRPVAVADTKYKTAAALSDIPGDDLYQMVSYCTALGLTKGHLLYTGAPTGLIETLGVRNSPIRIDLRRINLDTDRDQLLQDIRQLEEVILGEQAGPEPPEVAGEQGGTW